MRIEFKTIGDGTNVEITLVEDLDGVDHVLDRIYSADHRGGVRFGGDQDVSISARWLFRWVEDCWAPPVIGGRYGKFHPYWAERKEKKRQREALVGN